VNVVGRSVKGAQFDGLIVRTCRDWGVNQSGERGGLELDFIAALLRYTERRSVTPIVGQTQGGLIAQLVRGRALRIKHILVPVQHRKLAGNRRAFRKTARVRWRNEIESNI